jgi:hypothetical protein
VEVTEPYFPTGEVGRARSALFFLPNGNGKRYAARLIKDKKRLERRKIRGMALLVLCRV